MEGRHVFLRIRQSMPSINMASCARLKLILPSRAEGHTNRPRSRRLVNRHAPWPQHLDLIATPSTEQKQMARIRITLKNLLGLSRKPVEPAPHIRNTRRKPDLCIRQHRDHAASPRASSSTKPASTPSLTLSLRQVSSVISIREGAWSGSSGAGASCESTSEISTGVNAVTSVSSA